jgi:Flp pilus assembly protein TadD
MSQTIESLLNSAREMLVGENYAEAAQELQKVFSLEPSHVGARCLLAETMHRLGESEQALALLSDAVSAGGPNAGILENMGVILGSLGRREEEADFLMFASEVTPGDARLLEKAVSALRALGRQSDAEALIALAEAP